MRFSLSRLYRTQLLEPVLLPLMRRRKDVFVKFAAIGDVSSVRNAELACVVLRANRCTMKADV